MFVVYAYGIINGKYTALILWSQDECRRETGEEEKHCYCN